MRFLLGLIGIALIIFGLYKVGSDGFVYLQHDRAAQLGLITTNTVPPFKPYLGAVAVIAGVAIIMSRKKK